MKYFLSLGSNLGDRKRNLAQALTFLKKDKVESLKISSVYETQPTDFTLQPWFFNQVVEVEADFHPEALFSLTKKIEHRMERKPSIQKGPRIIDIDILLAETRIIRTKKLEIPHPRLEKRNFVLVPFEEISPETVHPVLNENIENLLKKSKDRSVVRLIKQ